MPKPKILLDTSPLANGHQHRGIGAYTRFLLDAFQEQSQVEVFSSESLQSEKSSIKTKPVFDLVHYPFFDLFKPTLPLRKKLPTVVTIHDVIPLVFPAEYPAGIKGSLAHTYQKFSLASIDGVLTDSNHSKQDIIEYLQVPAEKISVTHLAGNPGLTPQSKPAIKKARKNYGIPPKYLLYVGDINYNKNIVQLIKAVKFLPVEYNLVCVGREMYPHPIPEWHAIDQQLTLSEVHDRVIFINDLGQDALDTLAALYSGAEVYIQPSLYEGFGLPVLEAMQCQTPVVSTQLASLREVGGEAAVFSRSHWAEDLADAVTEVISWTQAQRRQRIAAASAWADNFSWQRTASETIDFYLSILEQTS